MSALELRGLRIEEAALVTAMRQPFGVDRPAVMRRLREVRASISLLGCQP